MFDFLNKKLNLPKKPSVQASAPPPAINQLGETIFEVGKEMMTRDPKTGEYIYRIALSPENRKKSFDVIQKNGGIGQGLINLAINLVNILRQLDSVEKTWVTNQKEIDNVVTEIRDAMKIDKRYLLNPGLGVLERREPPEG